MITDKSDFWEDSYLKNKTGWDLKSATPVFIESLDNPLLKAKKTLLIPGCGYGYDAIAAAKSGFAVTANDFSKSAVKFASQLAEQENLKINFNTQDFFEFESEIKFDIIYDYVMYCAINPSRRREYIKKVASLLNYGGLFFILLFPIEKREGGPPFGLDEKESEEIISEFLDLIYTSSDINSIKPRRGREKLYIYRSKMYVQESGN